MRSQFRTDKRTGGFTMAEMVVALGILTTLAAVVLPAVLQQVGRGEITRIAKDLKSVAESARVFHSSVQRWPATLEALAIPITSSTTDIYGYAIPADLVSKWDGPYLDRGGEVASGIRTGLNARIQNGLEVASWNGSDFLVVRVNNLAATDAARVDELIDGATDFSGGQVRHDGAYTLRLFATPIKRP